MSLCDITFKHNVKVQQANFYKCWDIKPQTYIQGYIHKQTCLNVNRSHVVVIFFYTSELISAMSDTGDMNRRDSEGKIISLSAQFYFISHACLKLDTENHR